MSGSRIGPYELTQVLGEGAFGRVWVAVDTRLGRKVAIKALRAEVASDEDSISRLRSEARNLAGLNHPNITMLLDIYNHEASDMLIMELVPGKTIEAVLRDNKVVSVREALAFIVQAVAGLAHAHQAGLTHRDIKPSNLMIADSGALKIMDFGLARARGSLRQTKVGSAIGTPFYLSPEQCRGAEGDERSDQYSLAVVLFEMLAGHPPFEADNDFDLMRLHLEASPPSLSKVATNVPRALDRAILRALAKKPDDRFESIAAFGREAGAEGLREASTEVLRQLLTRSGMGLVSAAATSVSVAKPPMHQEPEYLDPLPIKPTRRWIGRAAIGAVAMLLLAGVGTGYYVLSAPRQDPDAGLPAPAARADLAGPVTNVVSGNALSVNSATVNLYGISDAANSYDDVIAAQRVLGAAYPKTVLCYAKPGNTFECYDGLLPHANIALIAIRKGVARATPNAPETIYRATEQATSGK